MFINKIFYKLTNRKKYNELKGEQGNKERKAWYETSFRKKISDIQNKIQNNNNLNFLHSGHLGDIIDSLALIKELSKSHKCNLFIESNKKVGKSQHNHPAGQYYLNENMINKILPLLKSQSFLNEVNYYKNEKIDINLNFFREIYTKMNMASTRWYFHISGVHTDLSNPYLDVDPHKNIGNNKVVLIRSSRRKNILVNYSFLKKYDNLLFIGLHQEYEDLKRQIPNLEFHDCSDFLEMAQIIKGSKFFLGNITFGYCIAEALKVPRLLECSHDGDLAAVHPSGKNSYEFFFQDHFEKWFDYLYKL
tara:strand:+ start:153 stop:1067 length:915 start_codon:yes stop_codon:yes gene_type:complete